MKTKTIEVKTIYHIDIEFTDFDKIFREAATDNWRSQSELQNFNLQDTTIGNIRSCFKSLDGTSEQDYKNLRYVVRKLGFDSIENYGFYDKNKDVYKMIVYNNGADI